jgi:tryptophan halogenase
MPVPDSLQNKLEFFKERGDVVTMPKELFTETSWFSVLVGQGLYPKSYHPIANSLSKEELKNRMTQIYSAIGQRVQSMPHHEQFIAKWCASTLV